MKVKYFLIALLAFGFSTQVTVAQTTNAEVDVTVFESVISTADWAGFKYADKLAEAKKGDHKATLDLLNFSGTVDGRTALDHSVTLLELIASGGDLTFAGALNMAKPKLKSTLLERLQLAQGRTKKEELRKPLAEWAPTTWEVLNGRAFLPKIKPGEEKSCLDTNTHGEKPKAAENQAAGAPSELASPKPGAAAGEKPKG